MATPKIGTQPPGLVARSVRHAAEGRPIDTVTLDYDQRFRRRMLLVCDSGAELLLDLAEAIVLRDGDGLVTESGIVVVKAAPEDLIEIRCGNASDLATIAWHLGNRHLPTEVHADRLRIRRDHVIADMLRKLGAEIRNVRAPFDPLGGAYGGGHAHGH